MRGWMTVLLPRLFHSAVGRLGRPLLNWRGNVVVQANAGYFCSTPKPAQVAGRPVLFVQAPLMFVEFGQ